uniref:Secreted protein n=1 Tax=Mesocestoides corti TaxID=53468 RepID=A0A5K3G0L5_MESCO
MPNYLTQYFTITRWLACLHVTRPLHAHILPTTFNSNPPRREALGANVTKRPIVALVIDPVESPDNEDHCTICAHACVCMAIAQTIMGSNVLCVSMAEKSHYEEIFYSVN